MVKERRTELVEGFRHSVPYINAHRGKTFVIMLGGEAIEHDNFSSIVNDIGLLHSLGIRLVVVYGARPQIDANLAEHRHEPVYHKQTRVTDAKTLELVKQAAGMLQLEITARLSMSLNNTPLQGAHINVVSGNFIIAQPLGVDDGVDYCHSGRIRRIDEEAIHRQLDNGAIVLMGPVAVSVTGESFNLTSEEIATQLAIKLKAEKMIGFCSSQGVHNQDGEIVPELFPNEAQARVEEMEADEDYSSGTVRFLRSALELNKVAKGDVLAEPGFRAIYPYGLKKDEQLPALSEGSTIAFNGATCTKKQTEPPARYSQGKLVQEMEKLGLGTKSTRASIIERLYQVKYVQNDPIEPSQLGIAVIDALDKFAPHITHAEMTAELERSMDRIAEGEQTKAEVVETSRNLLAQELANLMPHSEEVADALSDAVAADAYVGPCPKCGKDLQLKASHKTKSMFIGCAGWPDCDVTYPLPKGKIEAVPEKCPTCGMPQVKVTAFRSKPRVQCIDPACASNQEPEVVVGKCPVCAERGLDKNLIARRNPRTLKRSITCENFDECQTRYPLPQYGDIVPTEEVCEHCGAPMVVIKTARGPWKLCPNFDCPGKEEEEKAKAEKKSGRSKGGRKAASKK